MEKNNISDATSSYGAKKKDDIVIASVTFVISIIRFLYYGFHYPHLLDDYIQYHNYSVFSDSKIKFILESGLLGARPLAGISDLFIWSNFYSTMIVSVIIISVLYAAVVFLLYQVFSRHFKVGFFFVVFCLLFPSGLEGIYWVSASSRIVVGLFFLSLSTFYLDKYLSSGYKKYALTAFVFQLLCFCYYEQVMLLSITLNIILLLINKTPALRTAICFTITLFLTGIYFAFTGLFIGGGVYSSRAQIILPVTNYYWDNFLPRVLDKLRQAYISAPVFITVKGFIRGIEIILADKAVLYILFILLSSAAAFIIVRKLSKQLGKLQSVKSLVIQIICGLLLAAAPASIHLVMPNPFITLRGTVLSYPGFALMIEGAVGLIICKCENKSYLITLRAIGTALCVALFLTAAVSELHDYRQTEMDDLTVMERLYPLVQNYDYETRITVLGVNQTYLPEQNYFIANHIHGVTESDWALTGAMRAAFNNPFSPYIIPLQQESQVYNPERIEGCAAYFIWSNNEIKQVKCVKINNNYNFYYPDGQLGAEIKNYNGTYWMSLNG